MALNLLCILGEPQIHYSAVPQMLRFQMGTVQSGSFLNNKSLVLFGALDYIYTYI